MLLSANWIRSSYYERDNPAKLNASLGSAFVNITGHAFHLGRDSRDRLVPGHARRGAEPFRAQSTGSRRSETPGCTCRPRGSTGSATTAAVRAFGSYTRASAPAISRRPQSIIVERLNDGPVDALLQPGVGTDRTWSAGARLYRTTGAHTISVGR